MKVSEINVKVEELRTAREELHDTLHKTMADPKISAVDRDKVEAKLRTQIRDINKVCYPMEVVRGKIKKVIDGKPWAEGEEALYTACVKAIGGVELG